jgi:hypothetical protein
MKSNKTHASKRELPLEKLGDVYETRAVEWGGFNVSFEKALADMDTTPFFKGLPDNSDQCPHWGFVLKGKIVVHYKDHEETIKAGEAYYLAPGHNALVTKGTEVIEFSPKSELDKSIAVAMKNLQVMEAKKK